MQNVIRAAQKTHEGILELCAALSKTKLEQAASSVRDLSLLTKREKEIFEMIAQNVNIAEMAKRLKISPRTVGTHRDTIRRKLGFDVVAQLNDYAMKFKPGVS